MNLRVRKSPKLPGKLNLVQVNLDWKNKSGIHIIFMLRGAAAGGMIFPVKQTVRKSGSCEMHGIKAISRF